ncbi:tRNA (adenine-N1)-methyltransferase [Candidatus Bathyarchaeota archaeon]|nr:MAG: tRNA (adenine-N1)-methyltransferase [Candidatus Bathyarchaeota archaeon]
MNDRIQEGDDVLLYLDKRRSYLVRVERDKELHTHKGLLNLSDLLGKEFGTRIRSSKGVEFVAFKPTIRDYIFKISRRTQIIYPKDIALIILFSGIGPGSRIVEGGTGAGALAAALANYVKPSGKVYSYEIREEFMEIAAKNLQRIGVMDYVELKKGDLTKGIEERNVDAVILDLATPWLVVPHAYEALRGSGVFVSFSPTIDQVVRTVEALSKNGFAGIETFETLFRGMQIERGRTRPETLMTGHTGYITLARKSYDLNL